MTRTPEGCLLKCKIGKERERVCFNSLCCQGQELRCNPGIICPQASCHRYNPHTGHCAGHAGITVPPQPLQEVHFQSDYMDRAGVLTSSSWDKIRALSNRVINKTLWVGRERVVTDLGPELSRLQQLLG